MSDDGKTKLPVNVDIGAKAEVKLEVKAEIPPESAGRLVENISDAFRYWTAPKALKPGLLRVQQEEVALKIAQIARTRIEAENALPGPVKAKLLIPIFERGSCEDIDDEIMIERWGNLLASAALEIPVQPRLVGILDELAGSQAKCLEYIAFGHKEELKYPYTALADSPYHYAEHIARAGLKQHFDDEKNEEYNPEEVMEYVIYFFSSCGVLLEYVNLTDSDELSLDYDDNLFIGKTDQEIDLSILQSLGLVRRVIVEMDITSPLNTKPNFEIEIYYYHLTLLGVDFCEACCRPRIQKLKRQQDERAKASE